MATLPEQLNLLDPIAYLSTLNRYLDASEAAELLHCSDDTIYRRCKDGSLGYTRLGNRFKFSPSHLIAYIEARTMLPLGAK